LDRSHFYVFFVNRPRVHYGKDRYQFGRVRQRYAGRAEINFRYGRLFALTVIVIAVLGAVSVFVTVTVTIAIVTVCILAPSFAAMLVAAASTVVPVSVMIAFAALLPAKRGSAVVSCKRRRNTGKPCKDYHEQ